MLAINEWMARPDNGNDWLELFNKSDLPVPLVGLKLSDDSSQPDKTVMPPLSFIGPKSHLRMTADNDLADGPTHLGFRLSSKGEEIVLTDAKAKVIDSVLFGEQSRGTSEGRFPDGAKSICLLYTSDAADE